MNSRHRIRRPRPQEGRPPRARKKPTWPAEIDYKGLSLGSPLLFIALRRRDIIHEPRAANRSRARVAVRKNSRFYLLVTEETDSVTIHNSPLTANSILRGDSLGISIIRRGGRPWDRGGRRAWSTLGPLVDWARFIVPSENPPIYVWPKFLADIEDPFHADLRYPFLSRCCSGAFCCVV